MMILLFFIVVVLDSRRCETSRSGGVSIIAAACLSGLPLVAVVWIKVAVGDYADNAQVICRLTGAAFCRMVPYFYTFCFGAVVMLFVQTLDPAKTKFTLPLGSSWPKIDESLHDSDVARLSSHKHLSVD